MSNLNKEIEDALAEIDVPSDKEMIHETKYVKRNQNESWKASRKELAKKQATDIEFKRKASEGAKKRCQNPDDPSVKRMKDFFKDDTRRANHKVSQNTPEIKELKAKNMRGKRNGFKGAFIGSCKSTGKVIKLSSPKECEDSGFNYYAINQCINGRLKSSGGYTWKREVK